MFKKYIFSALICLLETKFSHAFPPGGEEPSELAYVQVSRPPTTSSRSITEEDRPETNNRWLLKVLYRDAWVTTGASVATPFAVHLVSHHNLITVGNSIILPIYTLCFISTGYSWAIYGLAKARFEGVL